jgi:hypothetical protein
MKSNPFLSISFVALILVGTPGAALAQAQVQEQDPHHPEQIEQAPAAQPDQPGAPESGMPGMMGRGMGSPEMMRMMQRMMRMQDMDEAEMPGMGMPGMMCMPGMMGMMGHGMPGRGMMDHGAMHDGMMRLIFILMDTDGDGALSLDEVQAVTERIFNAIDADDDGRITHDEIREFYRGPDADRMQMRDRMPMRQGMQMQHGMMRQGMMENAPATQAYMQAMQTMGSDMAGQQMTGDPARDFALMMIPHHQSAIAMAEAFLEYGDDPELTQLANEIIAEQRREIEFLETWLRDQDQ